MWGRAAGEAAGGFLSKRALESQVPCQPGSAEPKHGPSACKEGEEINDCPPAAGDAADN